MEHYVRPDGLPPVSGYSHVVAFTGRMVAVSGQVPADRDGRLVGQGNPGAQVRQVFENLTVALAAAGATMERVVKLTVPRAVGAVTGRNALSSRAGSRHWSGWG